MEKLRLNRSIKFTLFFIFAVAATVGMKTRWRASMWESIAYADGRGYYAYLPAVFIYNDLNFGFFEASEEKLDNYGGAYSYLSYEGDKRINRYFCGVAVMQMPFFLMGHAASFIFDKPTDGFDKLYFKFIHIGAWSYLILGLFFLYKFLKRFNLPDKTLSFSLLIITFGTNLFYYAVHEPSLSHIYSFALFGAFLLSLKIYIDTWKGKYLISMLALIGLIILVRPANGLIVFALPFVAGSWGKTLETIKLAYRNYLSLFAGLFLMFFIISLQLIVYKISTGHFLVYSYGGATFEFGSFNLLKFLFSYKKGLFLYTPIYLMALLGFIIVYKKDRFRFYTGSLFIILVMYILSSWFNWWYGGSFSSRPMVEYLPFFAFPLAFGLANITHKWLKNSYIISLVLLAILCVIQTTQYYYGVIHWDSMDKEMYWNSIRSIKYLF